MKVTFARGGSLADPDGLFTAPGATRRAMDLREDDVLDPAAFKSLINDAVRVNRERAKR